MESSVKIADCIEAEAQRRLQLQFTKRDWAVLGLSFVFVCGIATLIAVTLVALCLD